LSTFQNGVYELSILCRSKVIAILRKKKYDFFTIFNYLTLFIQKIFAFFLRQHQSSTLSKVCAALKLSFKHKKSKIGSLVPEIFEKTLNFKNYTQL